MGPTPPLFEVYVARTASLLFVVLVTPACAVLNDVRHEQRWDEPVYFEVSRAAAGLELQLESTDAGIYLSVVERFDCIEEATQLGAESVYAKPKDTVLTVAGLVAGLAVTGAIAVAGSAITDEVLFQRRRVDKSPEDPVLYTWQQPRSVTSQLVGAGVGVIGVGTQLLLVKKIAEWLKAISFEEHRPVSRELGRKAPGCDRVPKRGALRGPGLPAEGLQLNPRGRAPDGFVPRAGLTLEGQPVDD